MLLQIWRSLAICLTLLASASAQQSAPQPLKSLSLEELSQLQITSVTKEPVAAFQTPAAISILTSEQIRHSGARTIPDVLRLVPGVDVSQVDSNSWAIGIRGFQGVLSTSVLVLIDGRSVYTPLFAGVYWDMQDVLLEDIERIEVIRGPGGTIWGSNAVNGVINIITKSARETHGTLVSVGGGNIDQGELNIRYGAGDDNFSYRVYGKGFTRGPEDHMTGPNFDDWRRGQFGFRTDSRLNDRDTLTIQGDAYGGEAGQELQISRYSPPAIPTVDGNTLVNGENVLASWQRVFRSGSEIELRTYWDRTDRQELNYRELRNTFDADFIHHISFTRNDVTWGLGVRISPSHFFQSAPTVEFFPAQQTYDIFSAFFRDEIPVITDRLSLTLGSKFEHTTYSGFDVQPSARLTWTPSRDQTFWAAVTRAVRTASRVDQDFKFTFLAVPSVPLYLRLIGDGAFSPEQLIGYEAGYRNYISKHGFVTLSLFHNRYNDLESVENFPTQVETSPAPPHLILPLYIRNGIAANTNGGELSALWDLTPWWRLRGSYSVDFLDAVRRAGSDDASTVHQLEGDSPSYTVVVQSDFKLPRNFDFNLVYRYVSAITNQSVPEYSTGDARLAWRPLERWELEVSGRNLLQPRHVEYGGDPGGLIAIEREVYAGITFRR